MSIDAPRPDGKQTRPATTDHASTEEQQGPPDATLQAGDAIGAYRVVKLIGRGAMGEVYEVEHERLPRHFALKLVNTSLAADADAVQRFFGEAKAASRIRHPGVVEVFDLIEEDSGRCFYVMELLEGMSLEDRILDGRLPAAELKTIAEELLDALEALHQHEIVHRDLKPENIFLADTPKGRVVKILDLGVAKLKRGVDTSEGHKTKAGLIIGTPAYMSPEQVQSAEASAKSDLYAFGVVLYEMVTGHLPFRGRSFGDFLLAHMTATPVAPSSVPGALRVAALDALVLDCLAKSAADRPDSAKTLLTRLRAIDFTDEMPPPDELAPTEGGAAPLGGDVDDAALTSAPTAELGRPRRTTAVALAVVLGLAAAAAAVAMWPREEISVTPPPTSAPPPEVTITIGSAPAGAVVREVGSDVIWGATPLERQIARASSPIRLRLTHDGFDDAERTLVPDQPRALEVALAKTVVQHPPQPAIDDQPPAAGDRASPPQAAPPTKVRRRPRPKPKPEPTPPPPPAVTTPPADPKPETPTEPDKDAILDPFAE